MRYEPEGNQNCRDDDTIDTMCVLVAVTPLGAEHARVRVRAPGSATQSMLCACSRLWRRAHARALRAARCGRAAIGCGGGRGLRHAAGSSARRPPPARRTHIALLTTRSAEAHLLPAGKSERPSNYAKSHAHEVERPHPAAPRRTETLCATHRNTRPRCRRNPSARKEAKPCGSPPTTG